MKTRKRWVSLLVAVVMVAGLLVPFVGTASATCTYGASSMVTVTAGASTAQIIGTGTCTFDPASWVSVGSTSATGSYVYNTLPSSPSGYAFDTWGCKNPKVDDGLSSDPGDGTLIAVLTSAEGTSLAVAPTLTSAETTMLGDEGITISGTEITGGSTSTIINGSGLVDVYGSDWYEESDSHWYPRQLCMDVYDTTASSSGNDAIIDLPTAIWVPSGVTGGITMTDSIPNGSIWAAGSATIATVGNSTVTVAAESTPALTSSGGTIGVIDVTENAAGALYDNGQTGLKLTLPPGFTWSTTSLSLMWGSALSNITDYSTTLPTSNDGRELDITQTAKSSSAQYFKITGTIDVDEATAATGNITVTIGGQTSANVSSIVVGSYGSYGLTVAASGTAPTITAGVQGSDIGELEVKEGVPGSIIWDRTITLTLPTDCAWSEAPSLDSTLSTNTGSGSSAFNTWTEEGTSGTEIQCTVGNGSSTSEAGPTSGQTNPGDFFLKNMEITPAVDFSGPVVVTVGGSEGLTGTVTLATVASGVTAACASTPDVTIGTASQTLGNVTITEKAAGNLSGTEYYTGLYDSSTAGDTNDYLAETVPNESGTTYLDIVAPVGVTFDTTPTVTVTSGNVQLGTATTGTGLTVEGSTTAGNQGVLQIPIDSSSTTASTIQIAAPVVTIDRTVPEGPITFKVEGTAVDETSLPNGTSVTSGTVTYSPLFPNDTVAAKVAVANVTTGTDLSTTTGTAVFTIGQTSYTLNGNSVTTDVAPYIKDGRTFLPLRYVANALGVADSNIVYDSATQKITIIKGSIVLQLTVGSDTMLLNGAAITMDAAPEITDGRACLPVSWVAQALGAKVAWDATAQTATISF
jgi:hypothetical protein